MFRGYFIDDGFRKMRPESKTRRVAYDELGIPMVDYHDYVNGSLGRQYNPAAVSLYALSDYNRFLETGKPKAERSFLNIADWLVKNLVDRGDFGVWYYDFKYASPGYVCDRPWVSGMAQGLGISVLVRAFALTGQGKYRKAAEKAAASFRVAVSDGGVRYTDSGGGVWYEEYACKKSARVLNGIVFALIGLHEMWEALGDQKAKELFDAGVKTLKEHMGEFELNLPFFKSSRYDNGLLVYAGDKYHYFHVEQMKWLHWATKDRLFGDYYERWVKYEEGYGEGSKSVGRLAFVALHRAYIAILVAYAKWIQRPRPMERVRQ